MNLFQHIGKRKFSNESNFKVALESALSIEDNKRNKNSYLSKNKEITSI